jgi:N-acetylglucosaminyldiphosphoundecaprenol N-acetyl-beta-D-mannosaminyltransferase
MAPASSNRLRVLGAPVDPIGLSDLLGRVSDAIANRRRLTVAYANVHVLDVASTEPDLLAFLDAADVVYCDGRGVLLAARALGKNLPERMTAADFLDDVARRAVEEGWRVGWVGGEQGVVSRAERALAAKITGFSLAFTHHGFIVDPGALRDRIAAARLDLLLVGMGTPVQERFVAEHRATWDIPVVWCVGGAADVVSGDIPRGPQFIYRRQEWLARLFAQPRRLWRRYLIGNPKFLTRVALAWWSR